MNALEAQKLIIKGIVAELNPEDRQKVEACVHDIKNAMAKYDPAHSQIAMAVLGSEMAAEA